MIIPFLSDFPLAVCQSQGHCQIVQNYQQQYSTMSINVGVYQDHHHYGGWEMALTIVNRVLMEAASSSLDLVLFPELFLTGYDIGKDRLCDAAVVKDGNVINSLQDAAKQHNVAFAIGYPERDATISEIIFNSMCVIDSHGCVALNYRKTHLYDPNMEYEKVIFTAGTEFPVADIYFPRVDMTLKVGALICFDIEFPEPARILALQGASIILISTADTENETHTPQITIPCRAAENNVFAMYANYIGPCSCFSEQEGVEFHGQSGVFGPDGSTLARFQSKSESTSVVMSGLLVAELSIDSYAQHKQRNNYLLERRPGIYAPYSTSIS